MKRSLHYSDNIIRFIITVCYKQHIYFS